MKDSSLAYYYDELGLIKLQCSEFYDPGSRTDRIRPRVLRILEGANQRAEMA